MEVNEKLNKNTKTGLIISIVLCVLLLINSVISMIGLFRMEWFLKQ